MNMWELEAIGKGGRWGEWTKAQRCNRAIGEGEEDDGGIAWHATWGQHKEAQASLL